MDLVSVVAKDRAHEPSFLSRSRASSVFSHRSVCLSGLTGVALGAPLRYEGALAIRSVVTRQTIQTTFHATKMIKMVAACGTLSLFFFLFPIFSFHQAGQGCQIVAI